MLEVEKQPIIKVESKKCIINDNNTQSKKTPKIQPTKENIIENLENISKFIEEELRRIKGVNVTKLSYGKILRQINKDIKTLGIQTKRIFKQKKITNYENKGFSKPVKISKDLANFCKYSESELKSRVEVTKYICNYISENELQNPSDRRKIKPDSNLRKLLNISRESDFIFYYDIQSQLKKENHFPR